MNFCKVVYVRLDISLVAPCLNEEENVVVLATRFFEASKKYSHQVEVVFVDDGSTDSTSSRIENLKLKYGDRVQLVKHASNQGIPKSWTSGCDASRGSYVCLIDSDLQNPPEVVFEMLDALEKSSADYVQAVRKPVSRRNLSRILMSRLLNWILNRSFKMSAKDNKSGFILAERSKLQTILKHRGAYRHFQTFIGVSANSHGFTAIEFETPFEDRRSGTSFLAGKSFRVALEVVADIRRARQEFRRR